jgi:hypothetical protein
LACPRYGPIDRTRNEQTGLFVMDSDCLRTQYSRGGNSILLLDGLLLRLGGFRCRAWLSLAMDLEMKRGDAGFSISLFCCHKRPNLWYPGQGSRCLMEAPS